MDQFTKEGRKLRPRKNAGAGNGIRSEKVEFNTEERRSYGNGEGRGYGQGHSGNGERRSYGSGEGHSYGHGGSGERKNFSQGHGGSEGHGYNRGEGYGSGEGHSYGHGGSGERKNFSQGHGGSEGHSHGGYKRSEGYGSGEGRSYGQGHGGSGESRGNGGRSSYGGGERRSFSQGHGGSEGRGYNRGEGHGNGGERGSYSNGGERRNYNGGERRSFGEGRGYGQNKKAGFAHKGNFGGKPGNGRKASPTFGKNTDEGINRMISRRPVVNGAEASDADVMDIPIKNEVRLNKFIANSGVCSRREADTLIQAGVVTVNGEVVTELGTKVNIYEDDVRFNGERLKGEEKVYIVMNKPKGYVTTASDPHADKTVLDLVQGCIARVYPVGRLDKNTTGVLMLTNDGEMAERLTHPSYDKKKIYQVALDREFSQEDFDAVLKGITLTDGEVCADELEYIDQNDKRKLGIEIHSGKNRIVRRIFESLGYSVRALDRVYFAGLTKKGLKKGGWRYLTEGEVNILKMGAYV